MIIVTCYENNQYLNNFYLKLFVRLLTNKYTNLKLLEKYIKHYNIETDNARKHLVFKELNFIPILIESKSLEKITWFFDNVQEYTKFIKKSNYLNLFDIACDTNDIEIAKYIYATIELCGLEITVQDLTKILNDVIGSTRWNNYRNNVVFELINLGIKPPYGYPRFMEYYNNLKIY